MFDGAEQEITALNLKQAVPFQFPSRFPVCSGWTPGSLTGVNIPPASGSCPAHDLSIKPFWRVLVLSVPPPLTAPNNVSLEEIALLLYIVALLTAASIHEFMFLALPSLSLSAYYWGFLPRHNLHSRVPPVESGTSATIVSLLVFAPILASPPPDSIPKPLLPSWEPFPANCPAHNSSF